MTKLNEFIEFSNKKDKATGTILMIAMMLSVGIIAVNIGNMITGQFETYGPLFVLRTTGFIISIGSLIYCVYVSFVYFDKGTNNLLKELSDKEILV